MRHDRPSSLPSGSPARLASPPGECRSSPAKAILLSDIQPRGPSRTSSQIGPILPLMAAGWAYDFLGFPVHSRGWKGRAGARSPCPFREIGTLEFESEWTPQEREWKITVFMHLPASPTPVGSRFNLFSDSSTKSPAYENALRKVSRDETLGPCCRCTGDFCNSGRMRRFFLQQQ